MSATYSATSSPTPQEGRLLLQLARRALRAALGEEETPAAPVPDPLPAALKARRGLFVSLHRGEELRGCMGVIQPAAPVHLLAAEIAVTAAQQDPRFPPVQVRELPSLSMEISILTVPRPISSVDEIVIGRDGLLISRGEQRGLLLPQVASERHWSAATFLENACIKAGLAAAEGRQWSAAEQGSALRVQTFAAVRFRGKA